MQRQAIEPIASSVRDTDFETIREWALDDSHQLDRVAADALKGLLAAQRLKMRIHTMLALKRRMEVLARVGNDLDHVESVLFDPKRIKFMRNNELIGLYAALATRELRTMEQLSKTDERGLITNDEEVGVCISGPIIEATPSVELGDEASRRLAEALDRLSRSVVQRDTKLVTPAPRVQ